MQRQRCGEKKETKKVRTEEAVITVEMKNTVETREAELKFKSGVWLR